MKQITFNSNFGRFNYSISANVGDDVNKPTLNLCIRGLADTGFRGCSSEVEKALRFNDAEGDTPESGIVGVTKNTARKDIPFSDEAVAIIQRVGQSKLDEIATKADLPPMVFTVTGEHIFDDAASPMVRATTFVDTLMKNNEAQLRATLSLFNAEAADADRAGLIEIANAAGMGIQPAKRK